MHKFAICVALFTLANAATLPIALNALAAHHKAAGLATTGSTIALQAVVVLFAPMLGRAAQRWGRRPILIAGFLALPLRGLLLATQPGAGGLHAAFLARSAAGAAALLVLVLVMPEIRQLVARHDARLPVRHCV